MFSKTLLVMGLAGMLCMPAWAQQNAQWEVGITSGAGAYAAVDTGSPTFGHVGVEVCAYCGWRYSIFGEYGHWPSSGQLRSGEIDSADLFGVGLRIQGRQRVRPFFDIGLAVGRDTFLSGCGCFGTPSNLHAHTNAGILLGGGVMVPVGKHLYIRPQVRIYGPYHHAAASAEAGFGWRF